MTPAMETIDTRIIDIEKARTEFERLHSGSGVDFKRTGGRVNGYANDRIEGRFKGFLLALKAINENTTDVARLKTGI